MLVVTTKIGLTNYGQDKVVKVSVLVHLILQPRRVSKVSKALALLDLDLDLVKGLIRTLVTGRPVKLAIRNKGVKAARQVLVKQYAAS